MGQSIHDAGALEVLVARVEALRGDEQPQWGRMGVGQMVCHLNDVMRAMRGELVVAPMPTRLSWLLKRLALSRLAFPKGRIKGPAAVDPELAGSQPGDFEVDRADLVAGMRAVAALPVESLPARHPILGPMSGEEWGRFHWKHFDHHLRQFGV